MIFDLNSLVDEAKRFNRSASRSGGGGGGGGGGGPPTYAAAASSRRTAQDSDDASLSSFTRSIARVARAVEGRDGGSVHSARLRVLPPPPHSPYTAFEDIGTGIHVRVEFFHVRAVCYRNKSVVLDSSTQPCACVISILPRQFQAFPHPSVTPITQHFLKGAGFNCGRWVVRERYNFYHPRTYTSDGTWPTLRSCCSPFLYANIPICSRSCSFPESWFVQVD